MWVFVVCVWECVLCVHARVLCGMCAFVWITGYDFVVSPQHANASTAWTHSKGHIPLSSLPIGPLCIQLAVVILAPGGCWVNLRSCVNNNIVNDTTLFKCSAYFPNYWRLPVTWFCQQSRWRHWFGLENRGWLKTLRQRSALFGQTSSTVIGLYSVGRTSLNQPPPSDVAM